MADELPIPKASDDEVQKLLEREWTLTPEQEALAADFREGRTTGDAEPDTPSHPPQ